MECCFGNPSQKCLREGRRSTLKDREQYERLIPSKTNLTQKFFSGYVNSSFGNPAAEVFSPRCPKKFKKRFWKERTDRRQFWKPCLKHFAKRRKNFDWNSVNGIEIFFLQKKTVFPQKFLRTYERLFWQHCCELFVGKAKSSASNSGKNEKKTWLSSEKSYVKVSSGHVNFGSEKPAAKLFHQQFENDWKEVRIRMNPFKRYRCTVTMQFWQPCNWRFFVNRFENDWKKKFFQKIGFLQKFYLDK